jgi:hypothetical protein
MSERLPQGDAKSKIADGQNFAAAKKTVMPSQPHKEPSCQSGLDEDSQSEEGPFLVRVRAGPEGPAMKVRTMPASIRVFRLKRELHSALDFLPKSV